MTMYDGGWALEFIFYLAFVVVVAMLLMTLCFVLVGFAWFYRRARGWYNRYTSVRGRT